MRIINRFKIQFDDYYLKLYPFNPGLFSNMTEDGLSDKKLKRVKLGIQK